MTKDRSSRRFWISEPLPGHFEGVPVTVCDIAEKGLQIEHSGTVADGSAGFLSYTIPGRQKPIQVHGQVRWTRPVEGARESYRSGILVDGGTETLNSSIDLLIKKGLAHLDRPDPRRVRPEVAIPPHEVVDNGSHGGPPHPGPKIVAMIEDARERLAVSFDDSVKWYNRARFSMADPMVQREVQDIRCKEDVLAVWEFLGRSVDLHTIARIFERR